MMNIHLIVLKILHCYLYNCCFRYRRIVEELQRGEIWDLSREEKLAFLSIYII